MKSSKNIIILSVVIFVLGVLASVITATEVESGSFVGNLVFLLPGLVLFGYGLSLLSKEKK